MPQRPITSASEINRFAQMGMAAMIPGFQYAIEVMQRQLDEMRAQLAGTQAEAPPKAKRQLSPEGSARISAAQKARWARQKSGETERRSKISAERKAYWAKMTPAQRKAEMKRRGMNTKGEPATSKKLPPPAHPRDPRHPKHAEYLKKLSAGVRRAREAAAKVVTPAVQKAAVA